jgi:hypothetical protein
VSENTPGRTYTHPDVFTGRPVNPCEQTGIRYGRNFRRLWNAVDERLHDRQVRHINRRHARQASRPAAAPAGPASGILRIPRRVALTVIAVLIGAASGVSFAESYRGLYEWAAHHGLTGIWAYAWPCQVDTFIAVGELALFVALVDRWTPRSRAGAWFVTIAGLAVSVAGNIGHVTGQSLSNRATAAIPPLAAASALAVGMGVLKRVVEKHHQENADGAFLSAVPGADESVPSALPAVRPPELESGTVSSPFLGTAETVHAEPPTWPKTGTVPSPVPSDTESAAVASLKATLAAGNPWTQNALIERFGLTRAQARRIHGQVLAESNGSSVHEED